MIKLNCDMGESFAAWTMGDDAAVMPYIDMANIACGFHAGGPAIMAKTIALAKLHGVSVGAHPAYPDLQGFGRRSLAFDDAELQAILQYQVGAMQALCNAQNVSLDYVKPHGALYNDMQRSPKIFRTVCEAIGELNQQGANTQQPLRLVTLATVSPEPHQQVAAEYGVQLCFEAFADRRYEADGSLRARQYDDAVLTQREDILQQVRAFKNGEPITTADGSQLRLTADTLCVHGDNPESIATVAAIRQILREH